LGISKENLCESQLIWPELTDNVSNDGIDKVDPLHGPRVLQEDSWEMLGDQPGGRLLRLFEDPRLKLLKAIRFALLCGYLSVLNKVAVLFAIGKSGFGRTTGHFNVRTCVCP